MLKIDLDAAAISHSYQMNQLFITTAVWVTLPIESYSVAIN